MACVVCDHTMQCLGEDKGLRRFWCPRCGTLKEQALSRRDQDYGMPMDEFWESPRWTRLLLDAQWHEVKEELLSAQRMRKALAELKQAEIVPGTSADNAVERG